MMLGGVMHRQHCWKKCFNRPCTPAASLDPPIIRNKPGRFCLLNLSTVMNFYG
jgi:hypothetical protein